MSVDISAATLSLDTIMRRPFQALTIRELEALDSIDQVLNNVQGEIK